MTQEQDSDVVGTRHSRNLAKRPQVAIAIYDSHRPGGWSAFYMAAVAEKLEHVDDALDAFNRRSKAQGLPDRLAVHLQ